MSFDWSDYFSLAQELAGQSMIPAVQEARLRASISRDYYAAFCKGRNHLRDQEGHPVPAGPKAHLYVRNQFRRSPDRLRRQIGWDLDRLRSDRNRADYDDRIGGLNAMTSADLALARRVLSALARLP